MCERYVFCACVCVRDIHMCVRVIYAYVCEIYACMCERDMNMRVCVRERQYACVCGR